MQASTPEDFLNEMKKAIDFSASEFEYAFERISSTAGQINKLFGQTRERINEMKTSLADALPGITRLGGDLGDVSDTISGIAEASRRNVIANTEDIKQMYAASKILETSSKYLTEEFTNVGIGISQIPKELEKSINYVQSIGGNTKQVMTDVRNNIDQMNRYQFEGGVQGLTKMAAQASMLKFDMGETFRLADNLFKPERAVEVASAFQRLGVSVGALADPFALMNQSINDPSGLQDSLVNVAKQFTYFDEKTKTFKINPQGVITLREMQEQTGVSAKEMSKLGLAAAELDMRISQISPEIKFKSEEDKKYLENIARMGEGGKYEVELNDGTKKELGKLNQEEFDKLIDQQKNAPKSLEDIARKQMSFSETIAGDVKAIKAAVIGGVVTQKDILSVSETLRKESTSLTGIMSKNFADPRAVRGEVTQALSDLKKVQTDISGGKKATDALADYLDRSGEQLKRINSNLLDAFQRTLKEAKQKSAVESGDSKISEIIREGYDKITDGLSAYTKKTNEPDYNTKMAKGIITGTESLKPTQEMKTMGSSFTSSKQTLTYDGKINVNVNITGDGAKDFSPAQKDELNKKITSLLNSEEFKQTILKYSNPNPSTKKPK